MSFVLSWGEAWFLDCRVIPQERHASQTARWFTGQNDDRARLVSPFHSSHGPPENDSNFYSPIESGHNSDEEEDEVKFFIFIAKKSIVIGVKASKF